MCEASKASGLYSIASVISAIQKFEDFSPECKTFQLVLDSIASKLHKLQYSDPLQRHTSTLTPKQTDGLLVILQDSFILFIGLMLFASVRDKKFVPLVRECLALLPKYRDHLDAHTLHAAYFQAASLGAIPLLSTGKPCQGYSVVPIFTIHFIT